MGFARLLIVLGWVCLVGGGIPVVLFGIEGLSVDDDSARTFAYAAIGLGFAVSGRGLAGLGQAIAAELSEPADEVFGDLTR